MPQRLTGLLLFARGFCGKKKKELCSLRRVDIVWNPPVGGKPKGKHDPWSSMSAKCRAQLRKARPAICLNGMNLFGIPEKRKPPVGWFSWGQTPFLRALHLSHQQEWTLSGCLFVSLRGARFWAPEACERIASRRVTAIEPRFRVNITASRLTRPKQAGCLTHGCRAS